MNAPNALGVRGTRTVTPVSYRARRWARTQLFSSPANTALTVVAVTLLAFVLYTMLKFVFVDADWTIININRRLIFLGRFPQSEEWRVWPPMWLAMGLGGLSYGLLSRGSLRDLVWLAAAVVFILGFLAHGMNGLLFGGAVMFSIAGYGAGRMAGNRPQLRPRLGTVAIVGWLLIIPFTVILISAFGGVKPALWGGLLLNVLLAVIGIGVGLPLGILLALSRASSLPVLKGVSTAIIEVTRGGPLIAWLFIARFVLPAFIPDALQTDVIVNAMIIVSLFTAAYVAEIVRGGLQSIDKGQVEAAHALGMGAFHVTFFIVLPQAIRAVIPALVSQMIALWKDTTLFAVLGFTDALGGAQAAYSQSEFIGRQKEALLFIALLFWSVSFGMSRLSQRVEKALGLGER
ncbi:MAG: amino acid ABC transporter permease [Chloroflexi bacterium]|nr:amino acid ABC transporter permease [Chloroflexota bacterium]